ncbi:hypothetical protein, partial [uncultured Algibacter sp.]|uniref:hypothetical protein n=1 Tax=uncultured Algibacter sp. TaxID=298659 RepID=UPI0032179760
EKTNGDISWSRSVRSADRGSKSGVNDINRDLIQSSDRTELSHKIKNGIWAVSINLGDHRFSHDNMSVKAEGITIGSNINSS